MRTPAAHGSVTMLLGKPVKSGSIMSKVVERLQKAIRTVVLHTSTVEVPVPAWLDETHLVIQRGLDRETLRALLPVETEEILFRNSIKASLDVFDRLGCMAKLDGAGIPTPRVDAYETWLQLIEFSSGYPVVAKFISGNRDRGATVHIAADGDLPIAAPFAGP
ncbi:MAG: hypothetical protein WKF81_11080 [Thermomicrobiales bacterium]